MENKEFNKKLNDIKTNILTLDIPTFYKIVKNIQQSNIKNSAQSFYGYDDINSFKAGMIGNKVNLSRIRLNVAQVNEGIFQESKLTTKTNPLESLDQQEKDAKDFLPTLYGTTLFICIEKSYYLFETCFDSFYSLINRLKKPYLQVTTNEFKSASTFEDLQRQKMEFDLNSHLVKNYLNSLLDLVTVRKQLYFHLKTIEKVFENYFNYLNSKHTIDGEPIYKNVLATDVALTVINNIDSHGELEVLKDPKLLSAYSMGKAMVIINYVKKDQLLQKAIKSPSVLMKQIAEQIQIIDEAATKMLSFFQNEKELMTEIFNGFGFNINDILDEQVDFKKLCSNLLSFNFEAIVSGKKTKVLSKEDKFANSFLNETVEQVVDKLLDSECSVFDLRDFILERKVDFVKKTKIEHNFYTCRISAGNPFLGVAPGALEIISSPKPNVNIENIKGSGFKEVKNFVDAIKVANEFEDLFIATSPRQAPDKANCLLIGPPGCGKTLLMRGLATVEGFSSIVASGSDFLTCWKGEDLKNPKRLFEHALKVHQDTGNHVHVCIDEIDSVLNSDRQHGETNLTLEFQILMDGMVDYPGVSIWGATNNPERIPMPMIRRFPKVLIVGELNKEERKDLLKLYTRTMPYKDLREGNWDEAVSKLEGATGDVIRKIGDHMWREKMREFVANNKEEAKKLVELLRQDKETFDIDSFDDKERFNFLQRLGKFVYIDPKYLYDTIDLMVKNIAISSEIKSAVDTYNRAKKFVSDIESRTTSSIILKG